MARIASAWSSRSSKWAGSPADSRKAGHERHAGRHSDIGTADGAACCTASWDALLTGSTLPRCSGGDMSLRQR